MLSFDDGEKCKITGKGELDYLGLLCVNVVLLVDVLNANLIYINQLYDQELNVYFTCEECIVINKQHTQLLKGYCSTNNCYMWSPSFSNQLDFLFFQNLHDFIE